MDRLNPNTTPATPDPALRAVDQSDVAGGTPAGAFDPWSYRDEAGVAGTNLIGYKVEATDGSIGKIGSDSAEVHASYLVVDTGPWIFGKKVMLPAGTVSHVDHEEQKVHVDRDKDQIKAAPEYDETATDPGYRDKLGGYYNDTYTATPPGWLR
ncbi:PRC-barrel domain containing protein [Micromonospora sp. Llam7]|uniref:PRC-barrel domain-containing protein n=1 Tax=Micromonospora tarapacensis TaxID=2835305 RepID=UPI001C839EA8|nr:PRC-barrel domain-containing protein [Micromonospora tarapacensis]MBX7268539.1 PRC-barrel domain containing protein [Micromonospora tarapacensis]